MPLSTEDNLRQRFDALVTEYRTLDTDDKSQNEAADNAIRALIASVSVEKDKAVGNGTTVRQDNTVPAEQKNTTKKNANSVPTLQDIRSFARLLVELYPEEQLASRSAVVSSDIKSILSGSVDPSWLRAKDSFDFKTASPSRPLLRELQRKRGSLTAEHDDGVRVRGALFSTVSIAAFLAAALLLIVAGFALGSCNQPLAVLSVAAALGSVGAWISVTFRLRDADLWALAGQAELADVPKMSLWLSPAVGGLGAVLAILAVATRVIGGDLVPKFDWIFVSPRCEALVSGKPPISKSRAVWMNLLEGGVLAGVATSTDSAHVLVSSDVATHFANASGDSGSSGGAKAPSMNATTQPSETSPGLKVLILLFFVALAGGWSERLVPDTLDWISGRLKPK